jgi:hypothetical protein
LSKRGHKKLLEIDKDDIPGNKVDNQMVGGKDERLAVRKFEETACK